MKLINKITTIVLGAALVGGSVIGFNTKRISELKADSATVSIENANVPDGYASSGTSGSFKKTVISTEDLTVSYAGINTRSEKGADHSYKYMMFISGAGYMYSANSITDYYVSEVVATFSSGTGEKGKAGIILGSTLDSVNTINKGVSGAVVRSGSVSVKNSDKSLLYWNFSTTTGNVQVTSVSVKYASAKAEDVKVTGVTLSETSKTVVEGESFDLTAIVAPDNATNQDITWTSSDESVAVVKDGKVSTLIPGTTTIKAETVDGGFFAECALTVSKDSLVRDVLNVDSFAAKSTKYVGFSGVTSASKAEYEGFTNNNSSYFGIKKDGDAGIVTTKTGGLLKSLEIITTSANAKKLSVYAQNKAYGKSKVIEGDVIKTYASHDLFDSSTRGTEIQTGIITTTRIDFDADYQFFGVRATDGTAQVVSMTARWEPVKPLSIDAEDAITLTIDGSKELGYSLVNNDLIVSETEVEFSSDNAAVSVTDKGVITGVSAGTANVTIKSKANENVTKTIAVTVSPKIPVKSVKLDKSELVVKETHTEELVATVLPEEASIKTVTWSSDDEEVATVDQDGKVTGVKAGTTTITVKSTDDDTKYAECAVTVEEREVVQFAKAETTTALIEGGKYIIVGEKDGVSYVMAHFVSGNSNVKSSDAELNTENTIPVAIKEDIEDCFYTLVANDDGTWSFFDGEKYLYAAGTGTNNNLKTTTTIDGKAKFAITFDDSGLVSVIAQDDTVNANLRFNKGNELFSCYGVDGDGKVKMDQIYLYGVLENENTAEALAQKFMIQTNLVCSGDADVDRSQPLASKWDGFKESYQALENEEKGKFIEATPSALIEAMLKRYDYIVAKYSLENFITDHDVSPLNNRVYYVGKQNNDSAVTIIAIVSVVSVTCLGVLVTLKKRKTINK